MDEKAKQMRVEALRGGEYRQTKFSLKRNGCYCVMGVLCELHRLSHDGIWESGRKGERWYLHSLSEIPTDVMEWAGLSSRSPRVTYKGEPTDLVTLNDMESLSFPQLAQVIEECL